MKFFFGDSLTCDDILDRHCGIVMQNGQTPLPSTTRSARVRVPQGGEAQTSSNKSHPWQTVITINRSAPFPFGKGGGIGPLKPTTTFAIATLCLSICKRIKHSIEPLFTCKPTTGETCLIFLQRSISVFVQIPLCGFQKLARTIDHVGNSVRFDLRVNVIIANKTRIKAFDQPAMEFLVE